jgi:membrane protease YdiL (CAAX protease family)
MLQGLRCGGLLIDNDRRLRPAWRAILFLIAVVLAIALIGFVVNMVVGPPPPGPLPLDAFDLSLAEGVNLAAALIVTGLFGWAEGRRVDSYGLPFAQIFDAPTLEGIAVGIAQTAVVATAMLSFGAMHVQGLALGGSALLLSALAWLGVALLVGLSEEFLLRGYFFQTLWKAFGFWPAAVVTAVLFAGIHFLLKPGENATDLGELALFSLLCCYAVRRTGTLWFAVGLHAAYDFMQFFVIGTPNGGQVPAGRLLDATFAGPAWLTGGRLGTEASLLSYPLDLLAFVYLRWRWRERPEFEPR